MRLANPTIRSFTIANGETETATIELRNEVLAAIVFPAEFTGTEVTVVAVVQGEEKSIYNADGTPIDPITVTLDAIVTRFTDSWLGISAIKIVSNAAEGADRTLKVITTARG